MKNLTLFNLAFRKLFGTDAFYICAVLLGILVGFRHLFFFQKLALNLVFRHSFNCPLDGGIVVGIIVAVHSVTFKQLYSAQ